MYAEEIPQGTLFMGSISTYDSHLFIKGFDRVISLDGKVGSTWAHGAKFEDYIEVDGVITVTAKK